MADVFLDPGLSNPPEVLKISGAGRQRDVFNPRASYAGVDIVASMAYQPESDDEEGPLLRVFGEIQTLSISSMRTVAPVRVCGRSSPIGFTHGPRTVAGTLVFAMLDTDALSKIYVRSQQEAVFDDPGMMPIDALPPFDLIISAANELGNVGVQVLRGVKITNFGTTYSVEDLYVETVYGYVAEGMTPMRSRVNPAVALGKTIGARGNSTRDRPVAFYETAMSLAAGAIFAGDEAADRRRRLGRFSEL